MRTARRRTAGSRTPEEQGGSEPWLAGREAPVVAVLDGGPDDAEVVDVALSTCVRRGLDLLLVHLYGAPGCPPTPLADAFAREYARGAMAVAHLVPGVHSSTLCVPEGTRGALRRELLDTTLLFASADRADEMVDAVQPVHDGIRRCRVIGVPGAPAGPDRLRLGYRLALQRELESECERTDGSTTPEELDDAWHVGVASPPLSVDAVHAWAACSAWPTRSAPDAAALVPGQGRRSRGAVRLAVTSSRA